MPYKKVKESQRLYQNLIESVDVGILSFDKDGKIFQGNRKASKLFDLAEGEGIGRSLTAALEKSDIFPGSSQGPQLYEVRVYKWE